MAAGGKDIYERFELAVRTPKRRLLLDAFLPPPESLESSVTPPAPPPIPEEALGEFRLGVRRDEEEEPAPRPAPGSKRRGAGARKREGPKSLQEEIDEFMKRDQTALAPEDEPESAPKARQDRKAGPGPKADPDTEPES